ncbi:unnamed protein product [Linum trigynum]|uniref:Uncharacterized protein n=1 Tax=Linum trigynum TaxID=586398 RepID=A0AAV2DYG6_9ROSI
MTSGIKALVPVHGGGRQFGGTLIRWTSGFEICVYLAGQGDSRLFGGSTRDPRLGFGGLREVRVCLEDLGRIQVCLADQREFRVW